MAEAEKTTALQSQGVQPLATRGTGLAPQCPVSGTNATKDTVRRYHTRYQRKQTYHYHHAP